MGRHLSRILLNKVLIQAHVAPFQTKPGAHNSPGTPLPWATHPPSPHTPPVHTDTIEAEVTPPAADVFPPRQRRTPQRLTWHTWHLADPSTPPKAENNTQCAADAGESKRVIHPTCFFDVWMTPAVSHEETWSGCQVQSLTVNWDQLSGAKWHAGIYRT